MAFMHNCIWNPQTIMQPFLHKSMNHAFMHTTFRKITLLSLLMIEFGSLKDKLIPQHLSRNAASQLYEHIRELDGRIDMFND